MVPSIQFPISTERKEREQNKKENSTPEGKKIKNEK